jgi:hypothetical protein
MNRYLLGCTAFALGSVLSQAALAQTTSPMLLAQSPTSSNNNPYDSPIHRANPNSMQGTQPNAPAIRGPNTVPVPAPPTLENGGIGNRSLQDRSVPNTPPTFIPNPPVRDSDSSNR